MADLQNQIIALRRKISDLENTEFVYFTEPRNPDNQKIWVDSDARTAKYWNGSNWILTGSNLTDWNVSVVFTATDYRTIAWTSGVVSVGTATSKTDYATTSGNFTMTQTTYFYWQADNPTAIQTSTVAGDVVTAGGILIAVGRMNPDTANKASLKVFGGPSVDQIIADEIVANSITANMIQANSITASKISTLNMTGKSCTFDTGTVGGWTLGTTTLTATNSGNTTTISSGSTAFSAGPTGSPTVTITQAGVLTATGAIINGYNVTSQGTFGGNGSDGAVPGSAGLTISGSNNTVIIKQYSSWAAGTAARSFTVTPTGCILYIKISGNADFTNWSFNFSGKGTAGGTGWVSSNSPGATSLFGITGGLSGTLNRWGGGGASSIANGSAANTGWPAGGTGLSPFFNSSLVSLLKQLKIDVGTWGGGGVGSASPGGNGWAGGWCVIIEVSWNLTLGSCAFNFGGSNGSAGSGAAGGWWGGWGGSILVLYNGTLTGTSTDSVSGGTWWLDGGGGSTWAGWAGGAGTAIKMKNTVFS